MPLTDTAVRNAKPKDKDYKLADSGGLYLQITPSGGKLWRLKYRIDGKEKKLALGRYPVVTLADARLSRDQAKRQHSEGKDPSLEKRRAKLKAMSGRSNSFGDVALEYIRKREKEGWASATTSKAYWMLDILKPMLGALPIAEIQPPEILTVLKKVEAKGNVQTAHRLLQLSGQVFRYGVASGRLVSDPTRDLKGALTVHRTKHHSAIIDPTKAGELLRAIAGYNGHYVTQYALKFLPHFFVRPGELRYAQWQEINFEECVWRIPAQRMKMRKDHAVPLSRQATALLSELQNIEGKTEGYILPSTRTLTRPISENTINAALRRLGYTKEEMTGHGFRSMASTLLNEARHPTTKAAMWSRDAIERALAHKDEDDVRGAYHRGEHWEERVEMAQWWSDYLDQLREGGQVLAFPDGRTQHG